MSTIVRPDIVASAEAWRNPETAAAQRKAHQRMEEALGTLPDLAWEVGVEINHDSEDALEGDEGSKGHIYAVDSFLEDVYLDDRQPEPLTVQLAQILREQGEAFLELADRLEK